MARLRLGLFRLLPLVAAALALVDARRW